MVELVDRRVGELLGILRESGKLENTLVVFASDHGDGNAHHHWNQKQVLYDESARVPFIVARPGSGLDSVDERQLVNSGLDLIPTLCGLAGIEPPDHLEGRDWSGMLSDTDPAPQRDHLIIETEFGTFGKPLGYMGRAVRTQRYKYMVYDRGQDREFLADMDEDPGETVNLAGDPEHEDELDRYRALLRDYIDRTDDIFPIDLVPAPAT